MAVYHKAMKKSNAQNRTKPTTYVSVPLEEYKRALTECASNKELYNQYNLRCAVLEKEVARLREQNQHLEGELTEYLGRLIEYLGELRGILEEVKE